VKDIETDLGLAIRIDPCIFSTPVFLLIQLVVLILQLNKCTAGGPFISCKGFERSAFTDDKHAHRCLLGV
jgi:hypothetical protein